MRELGKYGFVILLSLIAIRIKNLSLGNIYSFLSNYTILINLRFVKPLDLEALDTVAAKHKIIITMEENVIDGGVGMKIADYINSNNNNKKIYHFGINDKYVEHGDVSLLKKDLGLDSESIYTKIKELV